MATPVQFLFSQHQLVLLQRRQWLRQRHRTWLVLVLEGVSKGGAKFVFTIGDAEDYPNVGPRPALVCECIVTSQETLFLPMCVDVAFVEADGSERAAVAHFIAFNKRAVISIKKPSQILPKNPKR